MAGRRKVERQDRNGVKVRVTRADDGSTVEADCSCFGHPFRTHSRMTCPNRPRAARAV